MCFISHGFVSPSVFVADSPAVEGISAAAPHYEELTEDDIVFMHFSVQKEW
jgi:hypothetical protein